MRPLALFALLLVAGFVTQEKPSPSAKSQPELYEDADAYDVYAALLPEDWVWREAKASRLVIQQQTTRYPGEPTDRTCITLEEPSRREWQVVLEDYLKNNRLPRFLARKFPIQKPYDLLTTEQISAAFNPGKQKQGGWTAFYKQYPGSGGIIELSAVGFNPEKDRAIVYVGHSCGELCGGGTHYFLAKKHGRWRKASVYAMVCAWAS